MAADPSRLVPVVAAARAAQAVDPLARLGAGDRVASGAVLMPRPLRTVAVLFARVDSIYKTLPGCAVYDELIDATTYRGGHPVIAHPPCRLWGKLYKLSTAPESERELALFAVDTVRRCGGVLEHPAHSKLWRAKELPPPGERDAFGGQTLEVAQFWFGHRAEKLTWLYVCHAQHVPPWQLPIGEPEHVIGASRNRRWRPEVSKREREATPLPFALWLCDLARQCWPPMAAKA
jgi:hypothetical protein